MKNVKPITLLIMEREGCFELSLEYDYVKIISIVSLGGRSPRVNGFKDKAITEAALMEFVSNITQSEILSDNIDFMNDYLKQVELKYDLYAKDMQKIIRKLIIIAETKKSMELLKEKINQQRSDLSTTTLQNPLNKKPIPCARCIKCGKFYRDQPDDCLCTFCQEYVKRELRPNVWFECQVCNGTGYNARFRKVCSSCDEQGWLFSELFKL